MTNSRARGSSYLAFESASLASTVTSFTPLFTDALGHATATEADVQVAHDVAFTAKRAVLVIDSNTQNGNTIFALRDDGASVGAITVNASTTGKYDTGNISVKIAAASLLCFMKDADLSSTGACTVAYIMRIQT